MPQPAVATLLRAVAALTPIQLDEFMSRLPRLEDVRAGWRVRKRTAGNERYPARNDRIHRLHDRCGKSYGQIALDEGMKRDAVARVVHRARDRARKKSMNK